MDGTEETRHPPTNSLQKPFLISVTPLYRHTKTTLWITGLLDHLIKTSAVRQAARDAREAEKQRKWEEEVMKSPWAQDIDKRFQALMSGANSERKEGDGYIFYQSKVSAVAGSSSHQVQD